MRERVTMREVGAAAEVSAFTVSLALRGSERVAEATRARVLEAAQRLGYERDAAAAMLVARRRRGGGGRIRIGLLGISDAKDVKAFQAKSLLSGYEAVDIGRPGLSRLKRTLAVEWHRGTQGLLINLCEGSARQYLEDALAQGISFDAFSVVTLGPGPFSCVRDSAWQGMSETLNRVVDYNYKRICVLLGQTDQRADDDARLAATLLTNVRVGARAQISYRLFPANLPTIDFKELAHWLRAQAPDAVVVFPGGGITGLSAVGVQFPDEFAVAGVPIPTDPYFDQFAGSYQQEAAFHIAGLELLDQHLRLGVRGIPQNPVDRVLHTLWRDGPSLPVC